MFKMIGGDGLEYGPATADEVRGWILEHRANGQTKIRSADSEEWRPIEAIPEFAEALAEAYPQVDVHRQSSPPPLPDAPTPAEFEPIPAPPAARDIGVVDCLGRGWAVLGSSPVLMIGAAGLVWLILTATALATCVGGVVSLVLGGPLNAGLMLLYLRRMRGEPVGLGTVFSTFGPAFLPLMLVWVVTQVASHVGLVFCLLPGLFLKVIWVFGLTLAVDRGLLFWPALETSRRAVMTWPLLLKVSSLLLVAYLPLIVFEGFATWRMMDFMLETMGPIGTWRIDSLLGKAEEFGRFATRIAIEEQLVLLLNLPFAYAALMCAYERIFSAKPQPGANRD